MIVCPSAKNQLDLNILGNLYVRSDQIIMIRFILIYFRESKAVIYIIYIIIYIYIYYIYIYL